MSLLAVPLLCLSPLGTLPNVLDVPRVPDASLLSVPDTSNVPDVPGVPDVSGIGDNPLLGRVLDTPGVLDVSGIGDNPLMGRVLDTPGVLDVSGIGDNPLLGRVLDTPGVPDVSGIGDNPLLSRVLDTPGVADVPLVVLNARRPNDHLWFASSSGEPLSTPASLNPQGISLLLRNYPDKRFVDTLVSIASSGVRIGYKGNQDCRIETRNHRSALLQADVITKSIQSEIDKGRIKEISALPSDHYFCSPIGLVAKIADGIQTGWRMIFDLSSPEDRSVNDGIPLHYGSIVYETLEDAIRLVAQAGRGAVMMKRDLKSAFRHVPVSASDHWLLIFEWQGRYYVDMFLPFGLRTAPRIFNLFSEALHWVFETLYGWNLTHYLDDFLFIFPPGTDTSNQSNIFNQTIATMGLSKAPEKDSDGHVVTHLGFEFDSINMEVRLPLNKKLRALRAVEHIANASSISVASLEEVLGFLSHCCQVVPLGRPFLRGLFSLLRRKESRHRFMRTRIPSSARKDIKWWLYFLSSWSSISVIRLTRINHDAATDASGAKGIGGVYNRRIFSERVPARHRRKHINWKEMFAILHAFVLWHKEWTGGRLRLACDNSAVVQAIQKKSVKGEPIQPLQTILLIAAVFDIEIFVFWIPSEENIVADAASRHDYKKLANLGFQASSIHRAQDTKMSTLRQKLFSFLTTRSPPPQERTTIPRVHLTNPSVGFAVIPPSPRLSNRSRTGLLMSCAKLNPQRPKATSLLSAQPTSSLGTISPPSTISGLILSSGAGNGSTVKGKNGSGSHLPLPSSSESSTRLGTITTVSTSRRRYALRLPASFDLASLHGIKPPASA